MHHSRPCMGKVGKMEEIEGFQTKAARLVKDALKYIVKVEFPDHTLRRLTIENQGPALSKAEIMAVNDEEIVFATIYAYFKKNKRWIDHWEMRDVIYSKRYLNGDK